MKQICAFTMLTVLALAGCGGPAYKYDAVVTGRVTIDGELAKSGTVTFHPVGDGKIAIGRISEDGSYSLRTGQGDLREVDGGTVVPGAYIVTVSITGPPVASVIEGAPPSAGSSLVASKYAMHDTSDLKRTVKAGTQVINLELEPAEAPSDEASGEAKEESPAAETTPAAETAPPAEAQPATEPQNSSTAPQAEEPASAQPSESAPAAQPEAGAPAAEPSGEKPAQ